MELLKEIDWKKEASVMIVEILGSLIAAIGLYNFGVAAELPISGFSGIAILIYRLTSLDIGKGMLLLNIPVVLLAYRVLGRRFVLRSIRCMVIFSFVIDEIAPLLPTYSGDRLLAAICTGAVAGVGFASIYTQGTSTGGSDFIVLSVKKLKPHIGLGTISFCFEVCVILVAGFVFRDTDGIIYGLICNFLMASVMDKVMYGRHASKTTMIVTSQGRKIADLIDKSVNRGCTLLKGQGGYTGLEKDIVLCACNKKQMYALLKEIGREDPKSFMITLDSNEVQGEGFHREY